MLHENHGWILEMEYHLLFLYIKKLKTMKFWKKPTQLRMVQLGLHLLDVSFLKSIDKSIASTKTKYMKLNTKTQNIFCRLNENLMTFLYTLTGATRKQKEKKVFSFKVYTKVECC